MFFVSCVFVWFLSEADPGLRCFVIFHSNSFDVFCSALRFSHQFLVDHLCN